MRFPNWFLTVGRLILGIAFLLYGTIKLLGGQFHYGEFTIDSRTTDGPTLVWCFFGYSPVYGRLVGLAEFVGGALVLIPRTRLLGALFLLPITANITVMDFCFDFPAVKYLSLLYTLLCVLLIAVDYRKLLPLLAAEPRGETALPSSSQPLPSRRVGHVLNAAAWLVLGLFLANLVGASITPGPEEAARTWLVDRGWRSEDLQLLRYRASGWAGINRTGQVDFAVKGTNPPRVLRVEVRRPHSFVDWQVTGSEEIDEKAR
jgi:uncharacterized membrane protein YphA (DoxX/SURF4 family)